MILLAWAASIVVAILCRPRRASRAWAEGLRSVASDLFAVTAALAVILTGYIGLYAWARLRDEEDAQSLKELRHVAEVVCPVAHAARALRLPAALSFAAVLVFLMTGLFASAKRRPDQADKVRRAYSWFRKVRSWARNIATVGALLVSFSFFGEDADGAIELRIQRLDEGSRNLVGEVQRRLNRATAEAVTAKAMQASPTAYRSALDQRRNRIIRRSAFSRDVTEVWPVLKIPTPEARQWLADHDGFEWSKLRDSPAGLAERVDPDWSTPEWLSANALREARVTVDATAHKKAPPELAALDEALGGDFFESAVDTALDAAQPRLIEALVEGVPLLEPLYDVLSSATSSRLGDAIRAKARSLAERWLGGERAGDARVLAAAAEEIASGVNIDWARIPTDLLAETTRREAAEAASLRAIVDTTDHAVESSLPGAANEVEQDSDRLNDEIRVQGPPPRDSLLEKVRLLDEAHEPAPDAKGGHMTLDAARAVVRRHRELEAELAAAKTERLRIDEMVRRITAEVRDLERERFSDEGELHPEREPNVKWTKVLSEFGKRERLP